MKAVVATFNQKEAISRGLLRDCTTSPINHNSREVSKWDDQGNDVIVLAKHMCMIMMEMTDFTRGRGPLKTTMNVIEAAKRISEAGTKLDKLARY